MSRHDAVLARNKLLMLLTFSSGAVDAICYLGLGKVFTAFMTGNFVFLGVRIVGAGGPDLVSVIASMAAFAVGVHIATRFVNPSRGVNVWPRRVTLALALSVLAQAVFAALWIVVGGRPALTTSTILLGISGLAMGVQTAAVFSLGLQGVFTTAVTATFTVLTGDTAHWATTHPERHRLAGVLVALVAGAVVGGTLLVHARPVAPLLSLAVSTLVVVAAIVRFGSARPEPESATTPSRDPSIEPLPAG